MCLWRTKFLFVVGLCLASLPTFHLAHAEAAGETWQFAVMGSLGDVTDFAAEEARIRTMAQAGVDTISYDFWWRNFQPEAGRFDWSYYRRLVNVFKKLRSEGYNINMTVILSFHQCGGNVGDSVVKLLPPFALNLAEQEAFFVYQNGNVNREYLSPHFEGAWPLYEAAIKDFAREFQHDTDVIKKVYSSLGPAGEARDPSYPQSFGWVYPHEGQLAIYSEAAIRSLQEYARKKYNGSVARMNSALRTNLSRFEDLRPPSNQDDFFRNGIKTGYGSFLLSWMLETRLNHIKRMGDITKRYFGNGSGQMPVRVGGKIPSVHWKFFDPEKPRSAEIAAGLIDYGQILDVFKENGWDATFTAIEMLDDRNSPNFSGARTLVEMVAGLAAERGIRLYGENAIAIGGEDYESYRRMNTVLTHTVIAGLTALRMDDYVNPNGTQKLGNDMREHIMRLMADLKRRPMPCRANQSMGKLPELGKYSKVIETLF